MLIIDGHSLAHRAFHALKDQQLRTAEGLPTSAVYGVATMVLRLLEDETPDYLCKIRNYKPDYVAFLIAQWPGVLRKIKANRIAAEAAAMPDSEIPFDTHEPTNE